MKYIPGYLEGIQDNLKTVIASIDRALEYIENGPSYQNHLHPYHAAAVSTYNRLVSVTIEIQNYIVTLEEK